ncbi:tryptophan synthase beta subunit-like PLP-dependent enzyme [Xylariomycetidae sp. FL2044]|nr:tryptophan synthase beta subunit-like PLP-dependent enzyme [Xylariomycetidae sp. FL2044]
MGSYATEPEPQKLSIETPCIPSAALSRAAGCNIFLKLENLQPSGSFKSRGIGAMMHRALKAHHEKAGGGGASGGVHFYCSSGGNAGLACAVAAATLRQPCTIAVPTPTPAPMVAKLRQMGAVVHQRGENWAVADAYLREELMMNNNAHSSSPSAAAAAEGVGVGGGSESGNEGKGGGEENGKNNNNNNRNNNGREPVYVPPFDHPHIWEGASEMVREMVDQLSVEKSDMLGARSGTGSGRIDGIVCSCGGGGLVNGIMEGIERAFPPPSSPSSSPFSPTPPLKRPRVLAVETEGAASLDASVRAGTLVTLPAITSIATSLGAPRVSARTLRYALREEPSGPPGPGLLLRNTVVSDAEAVMGSVRLADDARLLVEVACGAAVATAYNGRLREIFRPSAGGGKGGEGGTATDDKEKEEEEYRRMNIVLVICGGSIISLEMLRGYQEKYGIE